jgi:ParB-like chromosome segregation protein Spo0J
MVVKKMPLDKLNPAAYNPRKDLRPGDPEYEKLKNSIETFGCVQTIVWNERSGNVVGGHQTLKILRDLGLTEADVSVVDLDDSHEKALNIALNKISGEWDEAKLSEILSELCDDADFDISLTGFDPDEIDQISASMAEDANGIMSKLQNNVAGTLADTFLIPPFSVLDARKGYWQDRKKQWLELGLKSGDGRGENLTFAKSLQMGKNDNGTSVFDPVLCEIMYRWFNVEGGMVLDPFAGGSVRGIVASISKMPYVGIDLRPEQINSNLQNAKDLGIPVGDTLKWVADDSLNMDAHVDNGTVDMILTCPPYFDLEVYSDDPRDVSNMDYAGFIKVYSAIMGKAAEKLKENRFAVIILSDVREDYGFYRDLTGLTRRVMAEKGLGLYNDIILINQIGSGACRVRRNMVMRKVVRTHQNVMVFYKGNPKNVKDYFPELKEINDDEVANMVQDDSE